MTTNVFDTAQLISDAQIILNVQDMLKRYASGIIVEGDKLSPVRSKWTAASAVDDVAEYDKRVAKALAFVQSARDFLA